MRSMTGVLGIAAVRSTHLEAAGPERRQFDASRRSSTRAVWLANGLRAGLGLMRDQEGFGENLRVIKWIVDRVHGRGMAVESPIGWIPRFEDIHWTGLNFSSAAFHDLMAVGRDSGAAEAHSHEELFDRFRDRLPKEFIFERELLRSRLWRSPERWELAHEA